MVKYQTDEFYARAIEIVDYLDTPEIEKTFTEFDDKLTAKVDTSKLTAEAEKIKARDDDFTDEAQKIFQMISTITERLDGIEEAYDFASVNTSIDALQNGLIQSSNRSRASSDSEPITFKGISLTIWTQFKQIFDKIKAEKRFNLEEMCLHVAVEIRELGGNIKKVTVQGFYERNIKKKDVYISTLDDIGLWLDSKLNVVNNAE
ncbi:hypothetical protein RhiirA4_423115 [Rhizophagus irregularis]|uniref:Uncharacterized protein n=1 Tax=Rhizophagus irregularis TaxID=588596 RepID=A0A2I1GSL6_9GLOM|nr:hypothetical protein RhiirA4_423115 [Rhizophagus irregularis]